MHWLFTNNRLYMTIKKTIIKQNKESVNSIWWYDSRKPFISNKDNKNVNESLIKKEKETYNKSNLIYNWLSFENSCDNKYLIAFLLDQNIHTS